MQQYEIEVLFKHLYLINRESWEQTRLNAYIIAQVNSKKRLKLDDIIKFPWENTSKHITSISNEDIERLKNKAKEYGARFSNQTNGK